MLFSQSNLLRRRKMERRCIDDHCAKNCEYASLEETTVKSVSYFTNEVYDEKAFNVYCNHPSFKKKKFVSFVVLIDEYLTPDFKCPIDAVDKKDKSLLSKLIKFFKKC